MKKQTKLLKDLITDEKLLTQHISGPVPKYKLLQVSIQGRAVARAWDMVSARVKG